MAKTQIKDYVFKPGMSATANLYPNGYSLLNSNKSYLQAETTAYITAQVNAGAAGFSGYTFDVAKVQKDVGLIIDAYLHDLRYGGNQETVKNAGFFWDGATAQISGTRQAEILYQTEVRNIINNFILTNAVHTSLSASSQTIDNSKTTEAGVTARITELSNIIINVITTGLSVLPTLVLTGAGTIKIQGRLALEDLLLITNATKNQIIYNFSNNELGGSIKQDQYSTDTDFPKFLQITDAVTTLTLNYDTSSHSASDEIQIFKESRELLTKPYDFGVDAIERMRHASPLAMLDADFEYGLQPTKWSAIGTLRGYPSIYEVPGTTTDVQSVVTDASAGTSGVGQSLITVTTVAPHGFIEGDPVTIKALENSIAGAARAEGSFIIYTVPTALTFTYYAKAKVGTTNGEVLYTSYTQLRKAGFYTGAAIGSPQAAVAIQGFTVVSQGASGTLTSEVIVPTGETRIPYDGTSPTIGAPLVQASIPTGSQTTAVIDNSAGGGSFLTPTVIGDVPSGSTTITLEDATGIVPNLAFDNGTGTAIYVETVDLGANTITTSAQTTAPLVGNTTTYTGVAGNNYTPLGNSFTINVSSDGTTYTLGTITSPGNGYVVGDKLRIPGTSLSGTSPTNDLNIRVDSVDASGGVQTASLLTGTPFNGDATYNGLSATVIGNAGAGATFDITFTDTSFAASSIVAGGADYIVNDRIIFLGSTFGGNGVDSTHDLIITVTSVDGTGAITGTSQTGTAPDASQDYAITDDSTNMIMSPAGAHLSINNISGADATRTAGNYNDVGGSSSGSGTVGTFDIVVAADGSASVTVKTIGSGHTAGDTITIQDSDLGSGGAANLTFDVNEVGTGVGVNAAFTVRKNGATYSIVNITPGNNFLVNETITVPGNLLGGSTPANDVVATILSVDGSGGLQSLSPSGTAINSMSFTTQSGTNLIGSGFIGDITLSGGTYSIDFDSPGDGGSNYGVNQQLKILGTSLGGSTPANDLTITATGVISDDSTSRGEIVSVSISGTASDGTGSFTGVTTNNVAATGSGATFTVTRSSQDSTGIYENILGPGPGASGYKSGDKIVIPGSSLGGTSPTNDLTIAAGDDAFSSITFISGNPAQASILNLLCTFTMTEATTGAIAAGTSISFEALATLEIDFPNAHGLVPGSSFIVTTQSDDGSNNHNLADGTFIATNIPAIDKIRYQARAAGTIDTSSSDIIAIVYPKPDSFFIHRPFDGGVQLGTGGPQHGAQAIRQSKKYIRYQSGKGIMYTTGALFAPSYDLQSVTADGVEVNSLITIVTDDHDHGVQIGGIIRLLGVETEGYNSGPGFGNDYTPYEDYTVVQVVDERTFKVRSKRRLGSTNPDLGFNAQMSVVTWHGATVRAGVFDDQNGIFWEYDGVNINVVQRTGTFQLAGTIAMLADANLITGTNTKFTKQLRAGDRVIIKGMTHVVTHVTDDTNCTVTPDFRGVNDITGSKMMYVTDRKVRQQDFNIDKLDGTGKSKYNMDPAKMQMIGIQYSWYGAGFIDYMVRGSDGNFVYCHRMRNSNVNTEAFMRSGNLPVRYEVTNEGPPGQLVSAIDSTVTTIPLKDASFFPTSGTIYINNEIISYDGISGNNLLNCSRGTNFSNFQAGATRTYSAGVAASHVINTGVVLISNTITPLISHWGSAFITDGGFDEDRGYIFSYPETNISVTTIKQTAFLLRLAPSVSNAIIGDLGERELLNRAQLLLNGIEITSEAGDGKGIIVEGVINPQNYPINPVDVGWNGLAGLAQGGQPSFAQVASGSSVNWSTGVSATTASATALATTTGAIDSGIYTSYNNSRYVYIGAADYRNTFGDNSLDHVLGRNISGTRVQAGTVINGGYISSSGTYGYFYLSQRISGGNIAQNQTDHFTITLNDNMVNSNKALFDKTSWLAAGAANGTSTTGGSVTWPAGSLVSSIALKSWAGTEYYEVIFNNAFSGTLTNGSGTVEFTFEQPPFALPGETVFSFIAVPGERSSLELKDLKEITNTPLGGRGTFPNGPDVLAINVYKISGTALTANILLKWGEAQA